MKIKLPRLSKTALLLLAIADDVSGALIGPESICTVRNMHRLAHKMDLGETQFQATLRSLKEQEYIEKVERGKYLITPKGVKKIGSFDLFRPAKKFKNDDWDGQWKVVIFDIPESKKRERNMFRSILKRKGFIKLQNSVFVSPFAEFEELNLIRCELGIEKYVNFLEAHSSGQDDDTLLRERFGIEQ